MSLTVPAFVKLVNVCRVPSGLSRSDRHDAENALAQLRSRSPNAQLPASALDSAALVLLAQAQGPDASWPPLPPDVRDQLDDLCHAALSKHAEDCEAAMSAEEDNVKVFQENANDKAASAKERQQARGSLNLAQGRLARAQRDRAEALTEIRKLDDVANERAQRRAALQPAPAKATPAPKAAAKKAAPRKKAGVK